MEIPGGEESTMKLPEMENPVGSGSNLKTPPWGVWIFSGNTHCCFLVLSG